MKTTVRTVRLTVGRRHYGRKECRTCGRFISNNALGRAAHARSEACWRAGWMKTNGWALSCFVQALRNACGLPKAATSKG